MLPTYQDLMRPVLAFHADGRMPSSRELRESMAAEFQVSEDDRRVLMANGNTPLWNNRVAWAVTYLAQAGALSRPRRGSSQITERGRNLLVECPTRIEKRDLEQFPEFVAFLNRSRGKARSTRPELTPTSDTSLRPATPSRVQEWLGSSQAVTPEETMDAGFRQLQSALADELLERIKEQPPDFFERLVLDVLTAMGYGGSDAAERLGRSGDGGIDGVIREDSLGLDLIYVQAKRWEGSVGRPVIQGFVGALHGVHSEKGVLITTSTFTEEARTYAATVPARVILIDGRHLAELMIEWDVGVTETTAYRLKRVDGDYFPEDAVAESPPDPTDTPPPSAAIALPQESGAPSQDFS